MRVRVGFVFSVGHISHIIAASLGEQCSVGKDVLSFLGFSVLNGKMFSMQQCFLHAESSSCFSEADVMSH